MRRTTQCTLYTQAITKCAKNYDTTFGDVIIVKYVSECLTCQRIKRKASKSSSRTTILRSTYMEMGFDLNGFYHGTSKN